MWRPGAAVPPSSNQPEPTPQAVPEPEVHAINNDRNSNGIVGRKNDPNGRTKKKPKKLSGATMGMRFMKRKAEATERQLVAEFESKAGMEFSETTGAANEDIGMDCGGPISKDECVRTVPRAATAADMFGVGAEIVGRRSFGGFNKAVSDTWKDALEMKGKIGTSAGAGPQISDEELIRRYQRVVKGRSVGGVDKSTAPIGNLSEKIQRQRNNSEKGEKRRKR